MILNIPARPTPGKFSRRSDLKQRQSRPLPGQTNQKKKKRKHLRFALLLLAKLVLPGRLAELGLEVDDGLEALVHVEALRLLAEVARQTRLLLLQLLLGRGDPLQVGSRSLGVWSKGAV